MKFRQLNPTLTVMAKNSKTFRNSEKINLGRERETIFYYCFFYKVNFFWVSEDFVMIVSVGFNCQTLVTIVSVQQN